MFISILKVWPFLFYLSCWKEEEKRTQYSWLRSKYTGVSVDPQDMGTYPISKTILVLTHWSETQMSGRQEEVLCVIWMTFQVFFSSFGSWNIKPDTSNAKSCSSLLSLSRNATNNTCICSANDLSFFLLIIVFPPPLSKYLYFMIMLNVGSHRDVCWDWSARDC